MTKTKPKKQAVKNLARHKIRFPVASTTDKLETAVQEVQVLVRAKNGWTTEAIAYDLGLSKSQVAYRIAKGMAIGERAKFRSGSSWVAQAALKATARDIIWEVGRMVSPKYL